MLKKLIITSMFAVLFSLGCGSGGGGSHAETLTEEEIHNEMCFDLGCEAWCDIHTEEDPDGAGTIQWCEDVED